MKAFLTVAAKHCRQAEHPLQVLPDGSASRAGGFFKKLVGIAGLVLPLLLVTEFSLGSEAVEVWGVDVVRFGIYSPEVKQVEDVAKSHGGKRRVVMETEFLEETFRIPAIPGTRFGFRYVINGAVEGTAIPIIIKKTYPGLKDPRHEKPLFHNEYVKTHEIGTVYGTGYGFDHHWELVHGTWTFQLFYGEKCWARYPLRSIIPSDAGMANDNRKAVAFREVTQGMELTSLWEKH
jgi:hypothetical protein